MRIKLGTIFKIQIQKRYVILKIQIQKRYVINRQIKALRGLKKQTNPKQEKQKQIPH